MLQDDYAGTITSDYSILSGDLTTAEGYLELEGSQNGHITKDNVPSDTNHTNFSCLSKRDPATVGFGPDYYAMFLMKVGQAILAPPNDEWSYLAPVIEPDGLMLRKRDADEVTGYPLYSFTSEQDTWYDLQVVFSGTNNEHVTINHGVHGRTGGNVTGRGRRQGR